MSKRWRHIVGVSETTGGPAVYVMRPAADGRLAYGGCDLTIECFNDRKCRAGAWRSARYAVRLFVAECGTKPAQIDGEPHDGKASAVE